MKNPDLPIPARWTKPEVVEGAGQLFEQMGEPVKKKRGEAVDQERRRLSLAFLRRLRAGERIERQIGDNTLNWYLDLKKLGIECQVKKDEAGFYWVITHDQPEVVC